MLGISMTKNGVLLALFAIATAGALALTNLGTQERIASAERAAAQATLFEILPTSAHDNDLLSDTLDVPLAAFEQLGLREPLPIYLGKRQGVIETVLIPAIARDGYSGDIRLIVGVNRDKTIAGVRVLAHKETPGLGDKIELKKHQWILSFNGKSLTVPVIEQWHVKKDGGQWDQFAGATITPRALVAQVRRALEFVENYHDLLFPVASSTEENHHE
jgi:electron transport complex protein RnfG